MRDNITLKQLELLWNELKKTTTIGEWKTTVINFRDEYNLSDYEAIQLANKQF
jgi:hypothetical protein